MPDIAELIARWDSPEGHPYKGSLMLPTNWTRDPRFPALLAKAVATARFDTGPYQYGREQDGRWTDPAIDRLLAIQGEYVAQVMDREDLTREQVAAVIWPEVSEVVEQAIARARTDERLAA